MNTNIAPLEGWEIIPESEMVGKKPDGLMFICGYTKRWKHVATNDGFWRPGTYARRITEECITDPVNHPKHYKAHPSGVECIQITEHLNFCRGNAMKYLWRAGEKGSEIEDLEKACWYINREIDRLKTAKKKEEAK